MSLWYLIWRTLVVLRFRFSLTMDYCSSVSSEVSLKFLRSMDFFAYCICLCCFLNKPETGRLNFTCDWRIDLKPGLLLWGRDLLLRKLIWVGSSVALNSESVGMSKSIFFFCFDLLFDYLAYGFSFLNSSYVRSIAFVREKVFDMQLFCLRQHAVQGLIADIASLMSTFSISDGFDKDYLHVSYKTLGTLTMCLEALILCFYLSNITFSPSTSRKLNFLRIRFSFTV